MPVTPFHFGPGLLLKALCGRHMSILTFGLVQGVLDLEPFIRILLGTDILHGPSHTWVAAILIAPTVAIATPRLCRLFVQTWNARSAEKIPENVAIIPRPALLLGACLGTLTHIPLDSIMHRDMRPWHPLAEGNGLYRALPVAELHQLCMGLGVLGALLWGARWLWGRRLARG